MHSIGFFLVLVLAFDFFFFLFLASLTADNFSFCVCADELPSYSVHLPLGASHISMQHPLAGGPWSGSGIGPGGSGTPFLLDGGKVTLWQLAAKETPKFYLFQTKLQRQLRIFFQPYRYQSLVGKTGWQAFEKPKSFLGFPAVRLPHLKGTTVPQAR